MPLVDGFSRGSPVSSALNPAAAAYPPRFTVIGSQDLIVKSRPNLVTHSASDELLDVRVSVARIAPSLLDLGRAAPTTSQAGDLPYMASNYHSVGKPLMWRLYERTNTPPRRARSRELGAAATNRTRAAGAVCKHADLLQVIKKSGWHAWNGRRDGTVNLHLLPGASDEAVTQVGRRCPSACLNTTRRCKDSRLSSCEGHQRARARARGNKTMAEEKRLQSSYAKRRGLRLYRMSTKGKLHPLFVSAEGRNLLRGIGSGNGQSEEGGGEGLEERRVLAEGDRRGNVEKEHAEICKNSSTESLRVLPAIPVTASMATNSTGEYDNTVKARDGMSAVESVMVMWSRSMVKVTYIQYGDLGDVTTWQPVDSGFGSRVSIWQHPNAYKTNMAATALHSKTILNPLEMSIKRFGGIHFATGVVLPFRSDSRDKNKEVKRHIGSFGFDLNEISVAHWSPNAVVTDLVSDWLLHVVEYILLVWLPSCKTKKLGNGKYGLGGNTAFATDADGLWNGLYRIPKDKCNSEMVCSCCPEKGHKFAACKAKSAPAKFANCVKEKCREIDHEVGSPDCPVHQRMLLLELDRSQYN
ncbi:hypothetical protein PR048_019287 [Dryococelus australis]|uniref:Uncharacterized protein n=1 Tax=Dryococelus australis TaxID=614101 RepID=A0ABQ9H341_9NEOP|nr:hypothetical protein PR048_019287 [Dryococelus australis]